MRVFSGTLRAGHVGARVRARAGGARSPRPRRRRAGRRADLTPGQAAAAADRVPGGIDLRRGEAVDRRDRRHAVVEGAAAADGAVDDAGPAAARRRSWPARRRTRTSCPTALGRLVAEDPTMRLEINPETHQLVLWCMGEAHADVLLDRLSSRYGVAVDTVRAAGAAARDGGDGPRARPERQADRRPRRVRDLPHRGRAAAVGRGGVRVRRQDRRRGGAQAVHPVGREGRPRPDGGRACSPGTR